MVVLELGPLFAFCYIMYMCLGTNTRISTLALVPARTREENERGALDPSHPLAAVGKATLTSSCHIRVVCTETLSLHELQQTLVKVMDSGTFWGLLKLVQVA